MRSANCKAYYDDRMPVERIWSFTISDCCASQAGGG